MLHKEIPMGCQFDQVFFGGDDSAVGSVQGPKRVQNFIQALGGVFDVILVTQVFINQALVIQVVP